MTHSINRAGEYDRQGAETAASGVSGALAGSCRADSDSLDRTETGACPGGGVNDR
jgi:hypothetical protein